MCVFRQVGNFSPFSAYVGHSNTTKGIYKTHLWLAKCSGMHKWSGLHIIFTRARHMLNLHTDVDTSRVFLCVSNQCNLNPIFDQSELQTPKNSYVFSLSFSLNARTWKSFILTHPIKILSLLSTFPAHTCFNTIPYPSRHTKRNWMVEFAF